MGNTSDAGSCAATDATWWAAFLTSTLLVLLALLLATSAHAGILGWLTSEAREWQFVQQTGGIRIGVPKEHEGRMVLPIEYDVTGTTAVTRKPTLGHSGLAVRRIEVRREGAYLVLQVITQLVEEGSDTGRLHFADLTGLPAGAYEVL
jgi:hypothetical protein